MLHISNTTASIITFTTMALVELRYSSSCHCVTLLHLRYPTDYEAMIAGFKALPSKPRVYAMTSPPLYNGNFAGINQTVVNKVLPPLVHEVCLARVSIQKTLEPGFLPPRHIKSPPLNRLFRALFFCPHPTPRSQALCNNCTLLDLTPSYCACLAHCTLYHTYHKQLVCFVRFLIA